MRESCGTFLKCAMCAVLLAFATVVSAEDGVVGIHDPSTIAVDHGKYYTYGTGGGSLVSDDGWVWRRGERPMITGAAPDVIHIGDRYYMYVTRGQGAATKSQIKMLWTKSLDPASPDYKWIEGGVVASSDGLEDLESVSIRAAFANIYRVGCSLCLQIRSPL